MTCNKSESTGNVLFSCEKPKTNHRTVPSNEQIIAAVQLTYFDVCKDEVVVKSEKTMAGHQSPCQFINSLQQFYTYILYIEMMWWSRVRAMVSDGYLRKVFARTIAFLSHQINTAVILLLTYFFQFIVRKVRTKAI
jgi:hypothetical protein